jgi:hypothetical protein
MDQTLTLFILFVYVPTILVYALILQQLNIRSQRTQQHTLTQLRNLELHVHGIAQDVQYICRALNDEPQQTSQHYTLRRLTTRADLANERNAVNIPGHVIRLRIDPAHLRAALQADSQRSSNDHAHNPQNASTDPDTQIPPANYTNGTSSSSETAPRDAASLLNGHADVEPTSSESWNWNEASEENADGSAERARERRNAELF